MHCMVTSQAIIAVSALMPVCSVAPAIRRQPISASELTVLARVTLSLLFILSPSRDFDAAVPHRFVLLGIPLVIWHDPTHISTASTSSSGNSTRSSDEGWRVFSDACPHRLVPLSEGRITPSGRLECPYVSKQQCSVTCSSRALVVCSAVCVGVPACSCLLYCD